MLNGLTVEAARAHFEREGPNDPVPARRGVAIPSLLGRLLNPMVLILLIAAAVAGLMGQHIDAGIIAIVVAVGVAIDFWQTYRSQRAADRLRDQVTITATVLRNDQWNEIPRREVVVGDIVRLSAGDLVPADAALVECNEMHVHEAALTGESLPVEKKIRDRVFLDNERVAAHVCSGVGLANRGLVTGEDIDRLSDAALDHVAQASTIFARVSPAQKTRILIALRRRGHIVGFLGDGINDAPSLHAADVGISVASAVDVARDAADIILLERDLRILHRGVLEGRRASGNVMKYLLMGTSSNFGNMLSMAAAAFVLPFLPMLPTH
ncbi:MAG TPA: HAD-IC family P-type ATPase [Bryobacteraceae bacterium]|nr:HAD-IC family P-type ATPase [Bryobacteraceae bacterium]